MPKRTYLDSGVLLAAFRGAEDVASRAMRILDDPDRTLLVSDAVWLETMPKPIYEEKKQQDHGKKRKRQEEIEFYEAIFSEAKWLRWNCSTLARAAELAKQYGIAAMDAIHIAHALDAESDELVTTEKSTKPMFRTQGIKIISIQEEVAL